MIPGHYSQPTPHTACIDITIQLGGVTFTFSLPLEWCDGSKFTFTLYNIVKVTFGWLETTAHYNENVTLEKAKLSGMKLVLEKKKDIDSKGVVIWYLFHTY